MAVGPGGKEVGRLALKVLPDTTEFTGELKAFAERIEEQVTIDLKVHLDTESVNQELTLLQTRMDMADLTLDIDTDLDAAGTFAQMRALLVELQALASAFGPTINVDLDSGGAAAGGAAAGIAGGLAGASGAGSHIGRQIALWGPLILAAAVGIAALGPSLAVLFPLLAGVGLLVGAVALGFNDLKDIIEPIKTAFSEMRDGIGQILTAGLEPLISSFVTGFLPVLQTGFEVFAQLFNGAATSLLTFLNSSEGIGLMGNLIAGLGPALQPLADMMGPLTEVFLRLAIAALPALEMMSKGLLDVTTRFAEWLSSADASSTITESMSMLGDVLQVLGKFVSDVFPPLFAAGPAVIALFAGIGEVLGGLFAVLQPVFTFMSEHTTTMQVLGGVLTGVAIALAAVAVAGALTLSPFVLITAGIGALIGILVVAYQRFDTFRAVVDFVVNAVVSYWDFLYTSIKFVIGQVIDAVQIIAPYVQAMAAAILIAITQAIGFFIRLYTGVSDNIGKVGNLIGDLPGIIKGALVGLGALLYNSGKAIIQGLIDGILNMTGAVADAVGNVLSKARDLLPFSPAKEGPFSGSGWTLYSGRAIIQGLIDGIQDEKNPLVRAVEDVVTAASNAMVLDGSLSMELAGFTDLSDMVALDPAAALRSSSLGNIAGDLDAAFDGPGSGAREATRFIFDDWHNGTGYMKQIASDQVAVYESVDATRRDMGAPE